MSGPAICALCGHEAIGYATNEAGQRLCHSEMERDCYALWTVHSVRPADPPAMHLVKLETPAVVRRCTGRTAMLGARCSLNEGHAGEHVVSVHVEEAPDAP